MKKLVCVIKTPFLRSRSHHSGTQMVAEKGCKVFFSFLYVLVLLDDSRMQLLFISKNYKIPESHEWLKIASVVASACTLALEVWDFLNEGLLLIKRNPFISMCLCSFTTDA